MSKPVFRIGDGTGRFLAIRYKQIAERRFRNIYGMAGPYSKAILTFSNPSAAIRILLYAQRAPNCRPLRIHSASGRRVIIKTTLCRKRLAQCLVDAKSEFKSLWARNKYYLSFNEAYKLKEMCLSYLNLREEQVHISHSANIDSSYRLCPGVEWCTGST